MTLFYSEYKDFINEGPLWRTCGHSATVAGRYGDFLTRGYPPVKTDEGALSLYSLIQPGR